MTRFQFYSYSVSRGPFSNSFYNVFFYQNLLQKNSDLIGDWILEFGDWGFGDWKWGLRIEEIIIFIPLFFQLKK